jgi:uncharacterized protein YndB with AHSA1/START domain
MNDRIEKAIELAAPIGKVWAALTDFEQFGQWFRVKLEGPFIPGKMTRGHITYPGYEHLAWEAEIVRMEPDRYFSFTWHPYAVDPAIDYSNETPSLVEFHLEETASGTRLTVTESGFDRLPPNRRLEAMRMNDGGWTAQMENIRTYVEGQN